MVQRARRPSARACPRSGASSSTCPQLADADLSSLRLASTGSAPVTPELAEKMRTRLGCPIVVRYACTESSSITGTAPDDPPEVLLHTVGRPQAGIELVLRRRRRRTTCAHGEVGVVTLRSPCSMRGYWNDPERTAETLSPDGWITTSDLGLLARRRQPRAVRPHQRDVHPRWLQRPPARGGARARRPPEGRRRVAIVGTPAPTIGEIGVAFVEPVDPARSADARRAARRSCASGSPTTRRPTGSRSSPSCR